MANSIKKVEVKITNVNPTIKKQLEKIAKYEEKSLSGLLRPLLRSLCEKYSPEIKD